MASVSHLHRPDSHQMSGWASPRGCVGSPETPDGSSEWCLVVGQCARRPKRPISRRTVGTMVQRRQVPLPGHATGYRSCCRLWQGPPDAVARSTSGRLHSETMDRRVSQQARPQRLLNLLHLVPQMRPVIRRAHHSIRTRAEPSLVLGPRWPATASRPGPGTSEGMPRAGSLPASPMPSPVLRVLSTPWCVATHCSASSTSAARPHNGLRHTRTPFRLSLPASSRSLEKNALAGVA
jgi:hypothetical protein